MPPLQGSAPIYSCQHMAFDFGGPQSQPLTAPSICSTVDDNPDFDNLDIVARDEEERYFDEEEPEDAPSPELDGD